MTPDVGGIPLPESLSGPCRRLRYHETNNSKVQSLGDTLKTYSTSHSAGVCGARLARFKLLCAAGRALELRLRELWRRRRRAGGLRRRLRRRRRGGGRLVVPTLTRDTHIDVQISLSQRRQVMVYTYRYAYIHIYMYTHIHITYIYMYNNGTRNYKRNVGFRGFL
jgi:hypothetical protein